jgi:hypothetical protein
MKPSAFRIERMLEKLEASIVPSERKWLRVIETIRAMADGTLDSQVGARICNGLGIMRACLETQKLEQLESRMDEIAERVARDRTRPAYDRTGINEAQRISH